MTTFLAECRCVPNTAAGLMVLHPECPIHGTPKIKLEVAAAECRSAQADMPRAGHVYDAVGLPAKTARLATAMNALLAAALIEPCESRSTDGDVQEMINPTSGSTARSDSAVAPVPPGPAIEPSVQARSGPTTNLPTAYDQIVKGAGGSEPPDSLPDGWLEGEVELTAFALANPDCDVRAVLAGFAALVRRNDQLEAGGDVRVGPQEHPGVAQEKSARTLSERMPIRGDESRGTEPCGEPALASADATRPPGPLARVGDPARPQLERPPTIGGDGQPEASCLLCGVNGPLAVWHSGTRAGVCETCRFAKAALRDAEVAILDLRRQLQDAIRERDEVRELYEANHG